MPENQPVIPIIDRRFCGEHGAVVERSTLVLWLLAILIGLMITVVGGVGFVAIRTAGMSAQMAVMPEQLVELVKGQHGLTDDMSNVFLRLEALEGQSQKISDKQTTFMHNARVPIPKPKVVPVEKTWWGK